MRCFAAPQNSNCGMGNGRRVLLWFKLSDQRLADNLVVHHAASLVEKGQADEVFFWGASPVFNNRNVLARTTA